MKTPCSGGSSAVYQQRVIEALSSCDTEVPVPPGVTVPVPPGYRAGWTCRSALSTTAAVTRTAMAMTARQRPAWTHPCHPWWVCHLWWVWTCPCHPWWVCHLWWVWALDMSLSPMVALGSQLEGRAPGAPEEVDPVKAVTLNPREGCAALSKVWDAQGQMGNHPWLLEVFHFSSFPFPSLFPHSFLALTPHPRCFPAVSPFTAGLLFSFKTKESLLGITLIF